MAPTHQGGGGFRPPLLTFPERGTSTDANLQTSRPLLIMEGSNKKQGGILPGSAEADFCMDTAEHPTFKVLDSPKFGRAQPLEAQCGVFFVCVRQALTFNRSTVKSNSRPQNPLLAYCGAPGRPHRRSPVGCRRAASSDIFFDYLPKPIFKKNSFFVGGGVLTPLSSPRSSLLLEHSLQPTPSPVCKLA